MFLGSWDGPRYEDHLRMSFVDISYGWVNFHNRGYSSQSVRDIAMANGITLSRTGIQTMNICLHAKESLGCDDLCNAGFNLNGIHARLKTSYVPFELVKGMKEGETKEMLIPAFRYIKGMDVGEIWIRFLVTAEQKPYTGIRFETAFRRLARKYGYIK